MIKKIKIKKFLDYINICSLEVKLSIISTVFIFITLTKLDLYINWSIFESLISNFIVCLIGSLFSVLSILFAGIAFISNIFSTEFIIKLNKAFKKEDNNTNRTGEKATEDILTSFFFLCLHIGILLIYLTIIMFVINSNKQLIGHDAFNFILVVTIYAICFTIFYLIALIDSCIHLNIIKMKYNNIEMDKQSFYDKANEQRIELILATITDNYKKQGIDVDIYNALRDIVDKSSYSEEDKYKLIKYFRMLYGK